VPNNSVAFFQDPSVCEIRLIAQKNRPLYRGFIVRVPFAIQSWKAIRFVVGRPDQALGIDEDYRTKVGSLLPAAGGGRRGQNPRAGGGRGRTFPVFVRG